MGSPGAPEPRVSVVVPVLNDAGALGALLDWFDAAGARSSGLEIIVADGGSQDATLQIGAAACQRRPGSVRLVRAPVGRGRQLAAGTRVARGRWVWMLHADSRPDIAALDHLDAQCDAGHADPGWGRFSVAFDGGGAMRLIALLMNWRSRATGICTGDQGIFVHRDLLVAVGGVPRQSLMEDIELSKRLNARVAPRCRPERIVTSARRWRQRGLVRTVLSMWRFRWRYWRGADPEQLAREYYGR